MTRNREPRCESLPRWGKGSLREEGTFRFAGLPCRDEFSSLSVVMTTSSRLLHLRFLATLLISVATVAITGCDSPSDIVRDIRKNLDAFRASPNNIDLDRLEKSFKRIDAVIKDLEAQEDWAQADLFRRQVMMLRPEYRASREAFLKWSENQAAGASNE